MKKKYWIGIGGIAATLLAAPVPLTLEWNNPPGYDTNTTIYIVHGTNLVQPMSSWVVVGTVPATVSNIVLQVEPGVHFYAAFASNMWSVSPFSNVYGTPLVPVQFDGLRGHR